MWISQFGLGVLIHCVKNLSFIQGKHSGLFYITWGFFFKKICFLWYCAFMLYLINFFILPLSVLIFYVPLSIINQWYDLILTLYILFLEDSSIYHIKESLVIETSLDLICFFIYYFILYYSYYYLPYYFYLVYVIYYFYLTV